MTEARVVDPESQWALDIARRIQKDAHSSRGRLNRAAKTRIQGLAAQLIEGLAG